MRRRWKLLLAALPLLAGWCCLFVGRYGVSGREVMSTLLSLAGLPVGQVSRESAVVVLQLRLPRIVAAAFVGAGLAASGAAF